MERAAGGERHTDDELASALEEEVARITSAIPIIGFRAEPTPRPEPAAASMSADPAAPTTDGEPAPEPPREPESRRQSEREPSTDPSFAPAPVAPAPVAPAPVAPAPVAPAPVAVGEDPASLSDDQVTALVDDDLSSRGTFAAIEHLQLVLEARAATAATPVVDVAESAPEEDRSGESEPSEADGMQAGTPTQAISWEDLPVPRRPTGPEPTFSPWVATAAIPIVRNAEPEPVGEAVAVSPLAPEPHPVPEAEPETRAEPLGLVPEELAPRDSEPVPVLPAVPAPVAPTSEPVAPTSDPVAGAPVPTVSHVLGPATAAPAHIDAEVADDADDVAGQVHAPVPSSSLATGAVPVVEAKSPPLFVPERTDLEPSPLDRRVGRAARLFWLWFAGTSSLISVGVGATLFTLGLSLRQLLVATLIGVGISFLPLGLGTLAGKWSGQPTMVVSRATFGLRGNVVPTVLALLTKLFWGSVLLWLAGSAAGAIATAEGWMRDPAPATGVALAVTILAAGAVAFFGYALVARVQLILTVVSAALIGVMIAATWPHVDVTRALAVPDALWPHVVTGAVLVFSYLGLAWAMSSAEVARYQRPGSSGAASMLWATFGAAVPPFVLVSYGGLLAASDPTMADRLAHDPVAALAALGLPAWSSIPLLLAVVLSLVSALVLTIYSAGFTLDALGVRIGRRWSTLITGGAVAVAGVALAFTVSDLSSVIRGVPTALAVPVAAWAGIFAGEMMVRTRRFHQPSLLHRGGVYPDWRWTNLAMLVVASVIGLGLVSSPLPWLAWEGYIFRLLGIDPQAGIGASNIGVVVALVLGLLAPTLAAGRAVRRQEQAIG